MKSMKSISIAALTVLTVLVAASPVLAGGPRHYPRGRRPVTDTRMTAKLHVGLLTPDGDSEFFDENSQVFTGDPGDLEDTSFTGDLEWALSPNTGVVFSLGSFKGTQRQSYLDFTDEFGGEIEHQSSLRVAPMTIGLNFYLAGRDSRISPYVGAGAGFYWWRYREVGDFILFGDTAADDEIIFDDFESDGTTIGYYLSAGVDFRITPMTSLFVEGRWHDADDEMADDFDGFGTIDLSGRDVSFGLAWRF